MKIDDVLIRHSKKFGVKVLSYANVGNHLHFHIKLGNRHLYTPFIRAFTASVAMAVTGVSRWKKAKGKFWDYRPFTRVVRGFRAFLTLKDYVQINRLEGYGYRREHAEFFVGWDRARAGPTA